MKASTQFVEGKNSIVCVRNTFRKIFYDMEIVKPAKLTLTYQKKLERPMFDQDILEEFNPTQVTLGEVLVFLKNAEHKRYIFYVADAKGALWAVYASWYDLGWNVYAITVSCPSEWRDGNLVVSREPLGPKNKTLSSSKTVKAWAVLGEVGEARKIAKKRPIKSKVGGEWVDNKDFNEGYDIGLSAIEDRIRGVVDSVST